MTERTSEELAEQVKYFADVLEELNSEDRKILYEAAARLRELDGKRIEGWVPNWPSTNGISVDEFVEFHLERETAVQGDQNVAHAILIIKEPQEEKS